MLDIDGQVASYGFYTTRFVEAEDPEAAENVAVDLLRDDPKLRKGVRNDKTNAPMIYLEELEEMESFEGRPMPGTGYTFFPSESDDEE